ncbi:MAG TPA: hypothetical protein VFV99_15405, partial [Kofleriaceae bacterium]|nr:hypothetical protein [Kofleriaceae bacterium]
NSHPPLARDPQGHLVELPKGTCAWRIGRETTGRPRIILAPDNQPMRFPLHLTSEQLVEMCGLDVYHVYAIDEFGNMLGRVTKLDATRDARELRNGFAGDVPTAPTSRTPYGQMTDLRFALEAMAQMMRTNSEALRAVTESQADWVKAIAVAKGMPRNVAFPSEPAPAESYDYDDDDEAEEQEGTSVAGAATNVYDVVNKAIDKFGDFVPGLLTSNPAASPKKAAPRNAAGKAQASDIDWDLVYAPNWEARDAIDLDYAHRKGKAKRAAKALEQEAATTPRLTLHQQLARDPALQQRLMAIKAHITPEEAEVVINAVMASPPEQQDDFLSKVRSLSVEEGAEMCRVVAADVREHQAGKQTPSDGAAA